MGAELAVRAEKSNRKALTKVDEQARHGNLPILVEDGPDGQIWHVLSRTIGGLVYEITVGLDRRIDCDCEARHSCWHATAVQEAIAGRIGHFRRSLAGRER